MEKIEEIKETFQIEINELKLKYEETK